MENQIPGAKTPFTRYQLFMVGILAILQFTIMLDFMVLSPLGAQLMEALNISPQQFGWVVSAYAFSAGVSGILAAGFADKFDRKKLLAFFYGGFIIGTFFCGISPNYLSLLLARIVTGSFGGVISSISFAIVTDIFAMQQRGRVMGIVQTAFAGSQVLGIPIGLFMATLWDWHAPFLAIVGLSIVVVIIVVRFVKPIDAHVKHNQQNKAYQHLAAILSKPGYLISLGSIALLATGGFMLMPFASAFTVYNLGIPIAQLPQIYMIIGLCGIFTSPVAGKLCDQIGQYKVFFWGSVLAMAAILVYCNLGISPFWLVVLINILMLIGGSSRMIAASALMTAIPAPNARGAFMSLQSSVQQISGGLASVLAGLIVVQSPTGALQNYDLLGYVVGIATIITVTMVYFINQSIQQKVAPTLNLHP